MAGGIQTSVAYSSPKGIPGQIADINDCQLVTAVCTTTVLPGTWVELNLAADGETFVCNSPVSTSATLLDGGVAVYDPMQDPYVLKALGVFTAPTGVGFPVGMPISVLRRGRVFVQTDAATTAGNATLFSQANVQHPSTTAASATNTPGYFTAVASNTSAGTETTAVNGVAFERVVDTTNHVALVTVNRPKAG